MSRENAFSLEERAVGTHTSLPFSGDDRKGIKIYVRVTEVNETGTLVVTLKEVPPTGGTAISRAATASLVAAGDTLLVLYPGIAATANSRISDVLGGGHFYIEAVVGTAAVGFSVQAELI